MERLRNISRIVSFFHGTFHRTIPIVPNYLSQSRTTSLPQTSMRTIPVILKNGERSLKINALLDNCSTRIYINADVAAELGQEGRIEILDVGELNGGKE